MGIQTLSFYNSLSLSLGLKRHALSATLACSQRVELSSTLALVWPEITYAVRFSVDFLLHSRHPLVQLTFLARLDVLQLLPSTPVSAGSCFDSSRQHHIE